MRRTGRAARLKPGGPRPRGTEHLDPVGVLSAGGRRGAGRRGAVHLRPGHIALRRPGPAGEPGAAAGLEAAPAGLRPDGTPDAGYRGRELARNAAMAGLALATGLRRREFTFLLVFEVPPAPPASHPSSLPVLFPVPAALAKGCKYRTTWIDAATLHAVHGYAGLDRAASVAGSVWSPPPRWGEPLLVTDPGPGGGRVNGRMVKWASLTAGERLRLVAPGGGSCLLAGGAGGGPVPPGGGGVSPGPARGPAGVGARGPPV